MLARNFIWAGTVLIIVFAMLYVAHDLFDKWIYKNGEDMRGRSIAAAEREHALSIKKAVVEADISNKLANLSLETGATKFLEDLQSDPDVMAKMKEARTREIEADAKAYEKLAVENLKEVARLKRETPIVDLVGEYNRYVSAQNALGKVTQPFDVFVESMKV